MVSELHTKFKKVEEIDLDAVKEMIDVDALENFRNKALNPHTNPTTRGVAENDDIYFQAREAQNLHYAAVEDIVADYMEQVSELTGRTYKPFVYYGHPEATKVIVAMGSVTETLSEVIDALNEAGEKVGMVKVHLYRPFSEKISEECSFQILLRKSQSWIVPRKWELVSLCSSILTRYLAVIRTSK